MAEDRTMRRMRMRRRMRRGTRMVRGCMMRGWGRRVCFRIRILTPI
jgi:hypothetical protein